MFLKHLNDILILAEGTSHCPAGGALQTDPATPIADQAGRQRDGLFLSSVLARLLRDRQGIALTLKGDHRLGFW